MTSAFATRSDMPYTAFSAITTTLVNGLAKIGLTCQVQEDISLFDSFPIVIRSYSACSHRGSLPATYHNRL